MSVTNGDTGHHILSRKETAQTRYDEAQKAAKAFGVCEYQILNHDCGIEPTLELRREVIRIIRSFAPDVVITHRLCDYHPDHRATAQAVQDSAFVCMVPHFCEDVPTPQKTPIFAFSYDRFLEPRPHRADAMVEIDSVKEEKITALCNHVSQMFEWLPWIGGNKDFDASKMTEQEKRDHIEKLCFTRFKTPVNANRERLAEIYGKEKGEAVVYAETFEMSPYSRTVTLEEFQALLDA